MSICYYDTVGREKRLLIINQRALALPNRTISSDGTCCDGDEYLLVDTFTKLNFKVQTIRNASKIVLETTVRNYIEKNVKRVACYFVVVLNDGNDADTILTTDGTYSLSELYALFTLYTVRAIPKVFLIQSCLGAKIDRSHCDRASCQCDQEEDAHPTSVCHDIFVNTVRRVIHACSRKSNGSTTTTETKCSDVATVVLTSPHTEETIIVYLRIEAYLRYGDTKCGCFMIEKFCKNLIKYGTRSSVHTTITMVQNEMQITDPKHVPIVQMNCTKLLFLGDENHIIMEEY
ncbi:32.6 kDA Caspase 3/7 [Spodoptera frugiperda ascovirus 1a]|uniref:Executioner caspase n=1 Tax=Spodoptera frugiperda ascovirus 1a TaxID=113370 RepID=CASP_SFAVA|nr:32.6 kDA Caspase 3/7 [Spodoptera frugiperda ascovirus 1a]Q5K5C1.1 RecName: Full=Executioner caspase [Spodoptera frugiperda ascovirus 1a]CAD24627.1 caspase 7-like protein [Spodoptera frugiperda ascovirus 1a]CAF04324.1 caspase [Spodoptera frugiperda ascovirus 1a]CAL44673.1 32.6 kDA Caspase 3/7 [Spodoptera frugiperda ascovirus 1a]